MGVRHEYYYANNKTLITEKCNNEIYLYMSKAEQRELALTLYYALKRMHLYSIRDSGKPVAKGKIKQIMKLFRSVAKKETYFIYQLKRDIARMLNAYKTEQSLADLERELEE